MDAADAGRGGDGSERAATEAPLHRGRIVIKPRVYEKVTQEVAADALRVERSAISVSISEGSRGIGVRLVAPLPVPDLDDTAAIQTGAPVLERAALIQAEVRDRVAPLIGRDVARVDLTITGAIVAQKKRVK